MLVVGWAIASVQADHCKGKHKNDPGCDGGGGGKPQPEEEDPPPFDPAIVYIGGGSRNTTTQLKIANADGSNQTGLNFLSVGATCSPNGKEIAFISDLDGWGIYWLRIDRDTGQVIDGPIKKASLTSRYSQVSWMPIERAGRNYTIAYYDTPEDTLNTDLYLLDPVTGNTFNLTNTLDVSEVDPSWSPDANRIAVVTLNERDILVPYDVVILTLGTSCDSKQSVCEVEPRRSLVVGVEPFNSDFWTLMWANTADKIAISGPGPGGNGDIWIIPFGPKENPADAFNLMNTNEGEAYPIWSPDDTKIMYQGWDYSCQPQKNNKRGYNLKIRNINGDLIDGCEEKMVVENGRRPRWWRGPFCGNGILDVNKGEECDDGNKVVGDGCSALCLLEP